MSAWTLRGWVVLTVVVAATTQSGMASAACGHIKFKSGANSAQVTGTAPAEPVKYELSLTIR